MSRTYIAERRKEAICLIKKGGLSARIGLAFLHQHTTT